MNTSTDPSSHTCIFQCEVLTSCQEALYYLCCRSWTEYPIVFGNLIKRKIIPLSQTLHQNEVEGSKKNISFTEEPNFQVRFKPELSFSPTEVACI